MTLYNVGDTVRVLEVASTGLWAGREGTYVLGGDDGENYPHTVNIHGVGAIAFRDEEIELVRRAPVPAPEYQISWFYHNDPDTEGYIEIMWDQFDTRVKLGFITIE